MWQDAEPPEHIMPMGVHVNAASKKRLIADGRYVNAFTEYVRFAYERLGDVKEWVGQDWYMWSTDDTSGYHHIPTAESAWKYLAFELGGRLMCFTHLPFGLKDACRVFTQVKQEIYRPLRGAGMLLNF
jgi:hypothetical protein